MRTKLLKVCPTLCDPMGYSPLFMGFGAKTLKWVAVPSIMRSSWPRGQTCVSYFYCISRQVLYHWHHLGSFVILSQFSSVIQSCPTLCNPLDYSTPQFPVHHQLLELAQTHARWVCDVIQRFHPLSSSSPPAFHLSQHQGLFHWVSPSHQVVKVLELQLQHQSFQWIFRTDFL